MALQEDTWKQQLWVLFSIKTPGICNILVTSSSSFSVWCYLFGLILRLSRNTELALQTKPENKILAQNHGTAIIDLQMIYLRHRCLCLTIKFIFHFERMMYPSISYLSKSQWILLKTLRTLLFDTIRFTFKFARFYLNRKIYVRLHSLNRKNLRLVT